MNELCTDNRFELIEKYKQKLIDGTNIETAQDEMAVIDNILFRFWQMGWLDKLDADAVPVVRCNDCKRRDTIDCGMQSYYYDYVENLVKVEDCTQNDGFCYWGESKDV